MIIRVIIIEDRCVLYRFFPRKIQRDIMRKQLKPLSCERIWVGKYKDNLGTFEILVAAYNRDDANSIKTCLDKIKNGEMRVTQKIVGEPNLMYIDEVGKCDYIRE